MKDQWQVITNIMCFPNTEEPLRECQLAYQTREAVDL